MDLISGSMFTDLGLELLVGLDILAIQRKNDIALAQTGLECCTVGFWQSHHMPPSSAGEIGMRESMNSRYLIGPGHARTDRVWQMYRQGGDWLPGLV